MKNKVSLENLNVSSFKTQTDAKGGYLTDPGDRCLYHTHRNHYCSDAGCYSDYCNSTDCNSGVYPL